MKTIALVLQLALFTLPAQAAHYGETYKADLGSFTVHGSFSKKSCSAQATLRSVRGARVGFAIYWRVGRSLHLLTTHPDNARVSGPQNMQFRFADGQAVAFVTRRNGAQLETNIGFGNAANRFYEMIAANPSLRIELPAIGDAVDVSLADRERILQAMFYCRDEFLH